MYTSLFQPITINKLEIRNRIAYPSLGLLYSYDQKLNDRYYNFFAERARGGAGIVTVGPVGIDDLGAGMVALSLADDAAIPSFKKVAGLIKAEGARAWIQLFHAGAYAYPFLIGNKMPIAPSAVYSKYSKAMPRKMTKEDIERVQEAFAGAAARAVEAGFDGVEIIASAGYLLTQFLSPLTNQRTDEYGGSFENRLRFPVETITRTRGRLGPDVPMTVRMAGNDFMPGSNTDKETPEIARAYVSAGVDAVNVTGGWHEAKLPQLPMELPRSGFAWLAKNIKAAVSVPVFASNRIADPETAERIIRDGYADLVNLGRVLIADPFWPEKARAGHAAEIRPCVACSQGCTDKIFNGEPVMCAGNPRAGFEGERRIEKTASPKQVIVVGAGLAGLEAAVTAAEIGHDVTLYEKGVEIGGQIRVAGTPPYKQELWEFVRYYRAMLKKYAIPVHLNTPVDAELIRKKKPDYVIVAEGARPLKPPVPGIDDPSVICAWDLLRDHLPVGKRVAVIGGGAVGLETALHIAARGTIQPDVLAYLFEYGAESPERLKELLYSGTSSVTVFEMLPKVGKDIGKSTKWVLLDKLERYGVKLLTDAKVEGIKAGVITYEKGGETCSAEFDTIVLAAGSKSVKDTADMIKDLGIPFAAVGDCVAPGKIDGAIHGGFLAALAIDRLQ